MKNKKKTIILITTIILICIILISMVFVNRKQIIKIARRILNLETKEITYEIYSNQNNKIRLTLKIVDTENAINEVELPDGDKLICNGKNQVGIDYIIENDGVYTFTSESEGGETLTKTLNVDKEFRDNLIKIEKVQEIATEQDFRVTRDVEGYTWYYSIGEENENWIEMPNYNILNVDSYKVLEKERKNEDGTVTLNGKRVHPLGYEVQVTKIVEGLALTEETYNKEEQILEGESLITCIRDNEIKSGNYTIKVNGEEYPAEIYNYEENVNYIADKNLGTSEEDNRMLIMKYKGNLNIDTERIITAETRKKGMFLYVEGDLTNSGEISMTARGAKAVGQDVFLWKHENGVYEYVPAVGASGGASVGASSYAQLGWVSQNGNPGQDGKLRKTGGGRSGGASAYAMNAVWVHTYATAVSGSGSAGTSYSGGEWGGDASARATESNNGYSSGKNGEITGNKTGGLLIISTNKLENTNGKITANSLISGNGGGSINIFYKNTINQGTIEANGLGNGGDGSITIQDINIKSPTISVDEITGTSFKINVSNPNTELSNITYDYYVNDELKIENSTETSEIITGLNSSTDYKVYVVMKLNDLNLDIFSNIINVTTRRVILDSGNIPNIEVTAITENTPLEYPIMTKNGMMNCTNDFVEGQEITIKITNEEGNSSIPYYSLDNGTTWNKYTEELKVTDTKNTIIKAKNLDNEGNEYESIEKKIGGEYVYDPNIECTASDALDKAAYDGDETTFYDGTSTKNKFYFGNDIDIYQVCFMLDPNFNGIIVRSLSASGYLAVPREGAFIKPGIFHITYYGKGATAWRNYFSGIYGKLYEIFYDGNID